MTRNTDLSNKFNQTFDVLIVGGGIYGATMLWEATSRGLSALLIEMNDFCSATSANSLKTIHGGLRYLQTLDLKRVRESIRERQILLRIAPHLVQPLSCLMPTAGHMMKSKEVMTMGLLMNDFISMDRNTAVPDFNHLKNGIIINKARAREQIPFVNFDVYTGAANWFDGQAYNSERLVFGFIQSAVEKGAQAVNYIKAEQFLIHNDQVQGVKAVDTITNSEYEIKADTVITTTGAWTNKICPESVKIPFIPSKAINLIVKKRLAENAIGINSGIEYKNGVKTFRRKSRNLFIAPWRHYTIIGTTHLPYDGDPDEYKVSKSDIQDFLLELNDLMPNTELKESDVTFFHGGVLPLKTLPEAGRDVQLLEQYQIFNSEIKGLYNVIGVKYTTARDVAEKTINRIYKKKGLKRLFNTRKEPLHGGDIDDYLAFVDDIKKDVESVLDDNVVLQLVRNYGTTCTKVIKLIEEKPELAQRLAENTNVIKAQVVYAVKYESAEKLADVVLRRTELGSGEYPSDEALNAAAKLMGNELGWDKSRIDSEIEYVKQKYQPQ